MLACGYGLPPLPRHRPDASKVLVLPHTSLRRLQYRAPRLVGGDGAGDDGVLLGAVRDVRDGANGGEHGGIRLLGLAWSFPFPTDIAARIEPVVTMAVLIAKVGMHQSRTARLLTRLGVGTAAPASGTGRRADIVFVGNAITRKDKRRGQCVRCHPHPSCVAGGAIAHDAMKRSNSLRGMRWQFALSCITPMSPR